MPELTKEQEAWYERALVDFRYFCRSLRIKIKDEREDSEQEGLLGPFIWRPAQEVVWAWMCEQMRRGVPIYLIILKARQFGISTFFCAWLFWWCWRTVSVRAMIAVKQKGTSMNALIETMDRFYQSLPRGFRPTLRSKGAERISKEEFYFDDRKAGGYFVAAQVPDAARGDAFDHAFCTEVGSYTRAQEFFGEFTAAMGHRRNTTLVLESTAAPGYFRSRYLRAKEQGTAIFLPWSVAPELYSRPLVRTMRGQRPEWHDAQSEELVKFTAADRKEMAFLWDQHKKINETIRRDLLKPVTEEQMWWWHWHCDHKMDGDEEYMRQEFPRDDVSAFERGTISAFKVSLPMARETVASAPVDCKDYAEGELEAVSDLTDDMVDEHTIAFIEKAKIGRFWQEREPGMEIYFPPVAGYSYTIGCDVADDIETAQDPDDAAFSVICVYCCNTHEQVAEWRGSIDPHDLGDEVAKVGYFYNTAIVCVEYNNMGITTIDRLTKYLNYPNRFKWPIMDEAGKLHKKKEMWWTDDKSKQLMIGSFRHAVKAGLFKVRSAGLYEEMMGYQNRDGHYGPGPDTFADRVMAAALAWQCVTTDQAGDELQSLVWGAGMTPKAALSADGMASRYVNAVDRSPTAPPPRGLPMEFDDLTQNQFVEDNWIFVDQEALVS